MKKIKIAILVAAFLCMFSLAFAQYTEIGARFNYSPEERVLEVAFFAQNPELLNEADASYAIMDYSANSLVWEGTLSGRLPQTVRVPNIPNASYTLIINNFLAKQQSRVSFGSSETQNVFPAASKTCAEQNGYACKQKEQCRGILLSSSDTETCCSVACGQSAGQSASVNVSDIQNNNLLFIVVGVLILAFLVYVFSGRGK